MALIQASSCLPCPPLDPRRQLFSALTNPVFYVCQRTDPLFCSIYAHDGWCRIPFPFPVLAPSFISLSGVHHEQGSTQGS
ncbi:hypothetical protein ASA_0995 [Aeromonas salmonicida subsp. salmonicida A449]|uniref:Uncharacterized protein n=1 Tax=Aeromonas salmonicida (strain A449) TaxID=382245 RepID=A4SJQ3_AERS4|nr:hypothetical protein ASA_0995 [Aeromonas salmonicida subsp. salmonicida A449]